MATRLSKIVAGGTGPRVPPHNLEAEESVLGACLLSPQAIANALEIVTPEDFYRPAHAEIFRAVLELYGHGEPVDAVTLAEELRRRGTLDEVGGKPYIFTLVSTVPTPGSVNHYARIVSEHATLRRLIEAAQQVTDIAYSVPEDVEEAVDQAEDLVYQVSQRRISEDFRPLKDLLAENMELVEKLYERGSSITGLPTGFSGLDDLTAGLQPANLIIVAARPSMGKCCAAYTLIDDYATGERLTLEELVRRRVGSVLGLSAAGRVREAEITDWIDNGVRPCFRVTTRLGRSIDVTANHPFLTVHGWRELKDLAAGAHIAVPRQVPAFGKVSWSPDMVRLLASSLAEGGCTQTVAGLTTAYPDVVRDSRGRATSFPAVVWQLNRDSLTELLRALFDCAGTISSMHGQPGIELCAASEALAWDVHHALVRLGVVSRIRRTTPGAWRITIMESASVDRYRETIGWIGEKAGPFPAPSAQLRGDAGEAPRQTCELVRAAAAKQALSLAGLERRGEVDAIPGRTRLQSSAALHDEPEPRVASSPDLYWDEIASIEPVGPQRVYDLTVPDGSNFIAQDICVHNSSLALTIAEHAAVNQQKPVVIFSLEMSKMELVQRLMCAEARVDSNRLRRGALHDSDWPKLSHALGRLAEAPIFIDDSANITIMEIRAKCRRLKSKHGLDLVIVDYLQLMQPLRRTDNRVQEVSEISRSLKILSRELGIPVIAVSQLSRNLEHRTDKRPLLADLRDCVTGETPVTLADGRRVPVRELVGQTPDVLSVSPEGRIVVAQADRVWAVGRRPVFEVRLASGREIRATGRHRLLGPEGWDRVGDLRTGDRLAIAGRIPEPAVPDGWPDARTAPFSFAPSRAVLAEYADILEDDRLGAPATSDLWWDRVIGVEALGDEEVFDLTVPGPASWLSDAIVNHNSGSLEQDADLVIFIYRDEVYNSDSSQKGIAEILVSKHRNGPIGKVELAFLDHYTKFANLARTP